MKRINRITRQQCKASDTLKSSKDCSENAPGDLTKPKGGYGSKNWLANALAFVLKNVSKTHYGRKKKKKELKKNLKILKLLFNNGKWSYPARASGGRRIIQNA